MKTEALALVPLPVDPAVWSVDGLVAQIRSTGKNLVTFLGFGELGYEDVTAVKHYIERELAGMDPSSTTVVTGTLVTAGYETGIAMAYEVAWLKGFETVGVHPSVALRSRPSYFLSAFVDCAYFVEDDTWGGLLESGGGPSPTLRVLLAATDQAVCIGGGRHTAQELREFLRLGIPIRFYAADMHHRTSVAWYRGRGVPVPDFRGAAHSFWNG